MQTYNVKGVEINLSNYLGKYKHVDFTRVYKYTDVITSYADSCKYNIVNKAYFGIKALDEHLEGVEPCETALIIAPPNIGKTALCQQIARYNCFSNEMTKEKLFLWFSTETSEKHLLERELQREMGLYSSQVQQHFIEDRENAIKYANHAFSKFENLRLIVGRINIDAIKEYCLAISDEAEKEIGMIMVDYAQRVRGNYRNQYENMSEVADKIGECSIGLNKPMILTSQTSRDNARNQTVDEFSAKGSGELDNCGQIIITMQKLKNDELSISDPLIYDQLQEQHIYIHQMEIRKKKRGKYFKSPLIIVQDAKTLELFEYDTYKLIARSLN